MAKRKSKKVVVTVPKSLTKTVGTTELYPNDFSKEGTTEWFFKNKRHGKKISADDKIVFTKESKQLFGVLTNNTAHVTFEITVKELEQFVAKVKKRQEYFRKLEKKKKKEYVAPYIGFFMHFNPELSFYFKK